MNVRVKVNKLKFFSEKFIWVIAEHAFLTCLFLFILALIFGGVFFYKYNILAQKVEPEILTQTFVLKEEICQNIFEVWQENERKFEETDSKEYSNPFEKPVPLPEED